LSSARADEVLDQQNDVGMSATADPATPFSQEVGQTFTVGVAGILTRIELQINLMFGSGGSAILTVYNTAGGVPSTSLGTASLSTSLIPSGTFAYQSFDLSTFEIPVSVGEVLAYGVKSSGDAGYALRSTFTTSTYAGGESVWRSLGPPPGAWISFSPTHDNGFRTYVEAVETGSDLPGDYNGDFVVSAADYTVWRNHLGEGDESSLNFNGNGADGVDFEDYQWWKTHYGEPDEVGAGSELTSLAPAPEPSASILALYGSPVLLARRRKRIAPYV
jgi:hypothetical protein